MRLGITADTTENATSDLLEVIGALEEANAEVVLDTAVARLLGREEEGSSLRKANIDVIIIVGSDRTLLRTLLDLGSREVAVLPVASVDQEGYLFDVHVRNFDLVVSDLLNHDWTEERHTRIVVRVGTRRTTPPLLNEAAIFPRRSATLMHYTLVIDGEEFWRDSSDGVIVSTPTGSTAYSMSVGGPVLLGSTHALTVIPVNSTNPARRPLVLPDDMTVELRELSSSVGIDIVLDGQRRVGADGGPIIVRRSPHDAVFVKFAEERVAALRGRLQRKVRAHSGAARALPPSAKLVLKVLEYHDVMTQREIVNETKLPARTVRHALSKLISEGLVTRHVSLRDSRQGLFRIVTDRDRRGGGKANVEKSREVRRR